MLTRQTNGDYRLESDLSFGTVVASLPRGIAILAAAPAGSAVTIHLGAVSKADSAGLALLVDWLAAARARGITLKFDGLSTSLRALAKLSDVEALLDPQGSTG
jgi:phospholipid transport system transporter-binding protein